MDSGKQIRKSKTNKKIEVFNKEESKALYTIIKEYQRNAPESDEEHYDDYYNEYNYPIKKRIIDSLLKKIGNLLSNEQKIDINKDFLRKKYHTFNNEIGKNVYSKIKKASSNLETVEINYFNMKRGEFKKRKVDIYSISSKYIIGYCHLRKDMRKFRISRISSARLTDNFYSIPQNFNKNNY